MIAVQNFITTYTQGQLTSQLETERQAELGKMQSQQNGQMESITASLQKAAENHQKLVNHINQLLTKPKILYRNRNGINYLLTKSIWKKI
jgi:hypothetical protein